MRGAARLAAGLALAAGCAGGPAPISSASSASEAEWVAEIDPAGFDAEGPVALIVGEWVFTEADLDAALAAAGAGAEGRAAQLEAWAIECLLALSTQWGDGAIAERELAAALAADDAAGGPRPHPSRRNAVLRRLAAERAAGFEAWRAAEAAGSASAPREAWMPDYRRRLGGLLAAMLVRAFVWPAGVRDAVAAFAARLREHPERAATK